MYRINIDRSDRSRLHVVDTTDKRCLPPKKEKGKRHGFWGDVETIGESLRVADRHAVKLLACQIFKWRDEDLRSVSERV